LTGNIIFAQDTPLEISGSADVYYKYDFAKKENTSFATDQNSVSLGMLDIALKKTTGKASCRGDFLRSNNFSLYLMAMVLI
jgi:hypothetical protein